MQHICPTQTNLTRRFELRILLHASRVGVVKFTCPTVAADLHFVREERIESDHPSHAVAQDLCVGIPPQKKMRHQRLAEYETRHLGIRCIVEQEVQRMLRHTFLALPLVGIDMKRQPRDGFGEDAHTSIDCRRLHRSPFIDHLSCRRRSKQKD